MKMMTSKSSLRNLLSLALVMALSTCSLVTRPTQGLATPARRGGRRLGRPSPPSGGRVGGGGPGVDAGFDDAKIGAPVAATSSSPSSSSSSAPPPRRIYSLPALYDLAFGYRNYEVEVEFLVSQHRLLHGGRAPRRVLEVAAGPARHCIEALRASHVTSATALDNSPEMAAYARDVADNELRRRAPLRDGGEGTSAGTSATSTGGVFSYVEADMTDFSFDADGNEGSGDRAGAPFDSAWILLGSLQHLTTNGQVIDCLRCVHQALRPDGTLIVELPHPRETFSLVECTRNGWEVPLEDEDGNISGELEIIWGDDDDAFDPIRQVRQFTVAMELKTKNDAGVETTTQSVKEVVPLRHFTSQEIELLARISGFQVTSMHGALANGVDVNDEDEAFRLVCVLQKQDDK